MPSAGASGEVEMISRELARSGGSTGAGPGLAGATPVRRQFFGLGRSTVAQTPFMSCLSRHAIDRGVKGEVKVISRELARRDDRDTALRSPRYASFYPL